MGGKAFAHHDPPLATPRMPSALYDKLRDQYIDLLSTVFQYVASPIPAPGKTSHGDIDILVSVPHVQYTSESGTANAECPAKQAILTLFEPTGVLHESETLNLAIPHPETPNIYIQVDVHIVPTFGQWRWLLFTHSYGDAFNLIGTNLHKVGLTGTDKGLFARDAEIEVHDGKKSRLFLSNDPASVLTFLHLNPSNWLPNPNLQSHTPAHPFTSANELFHAICQMRYFSPEHFASSDLRSSDRQRLNKREQYTAFVSTFLPEYVSEASSSFGSTSVSVSKTSFSRETVFHEALAFWNKRDEWRRVKTIWEQERLVLLTRRSVREEKKLVAAEEQRYADAWMAWTGYLM